MLARSIRQGGVAAYRWYSAHELAKFLHLIVLLLFIREGLIITNRSFMNWVNRCFPLRK